MIAPVDIAALAELYDRYANALSETHLTGCWPVGNFMPGSNRSMLRKAGL